MKQSLHWVTTEVRRHRTKLPSPGICAALTYTVSRRSFVFTWRGRIQEDPGTEGTSNKLWTYSIHPSVCPSVCLSVHPCRYLIPSERAKGWSKIPRILWNPDGSLPFPHSHILSQTTKLHFLQLCLFKIYFNIILPTTQQHWRRSKMMKTTGRSKMWLGRRK
jgi:hypothetical protein